MTTPNIKSMNQRLVYDAVDNDPGSDLYEIAEETQLTEDSVQRALDKLEDKGLVAQLGDESNVRYVTTTPTPVAFSPATTGTIKPTRHRSPDAGTLPAPVSHIREWAQANGVPVGQKGRLKPDVIERYEAAHG